MIRTFSCAVLLGLLLSVHASAQQIPEPPPELVLTGWDFQPEENSTVGPGDISWHVWVNVTNNDDRGDMIASLKVRWQVLDINENWVYYDQYMASDDETIPEEATKRLQTGSVKVGVPEGFYRFEIKVTAKIVIDGVATQSATFTRHVEFTVDQ